MGPGYYDALDQFKKLKASPCGVKYTATTIGKESSNGYYHLIGNHLLYEPGFVTTPSKKLLKRMRVQNSKVNVSACFGDGVNIDNIYNRSKNLKLRSSSRGGGGGGGRDRANSTSSCSAASAA